MIPGIGLLPDYPATIRCRASPGLFGHYAKPDFSWTVQMISEAGLLPDYPATLSEVGLFLTPETAQDLSMKAKTYLFNNYNTNIRKDKLSQHTHTPDTDTYDTQ